MYNIVRKEVNRLRDYIPALSNHQDVWSSKFFRKNSLHILFKFRAEVQSEVSQDVYDTFYAKYFCRHSYFWCTTLARTTVRTVPDGDIVLQ